MGTLGKRVSSWFGRPPALKTADYPTVPSLSTPESTSLRSTRTRQLSQTSTEKASPPPEETATQVIYHPAQTLTRTLSQNVMQVHSAEAESMTMTTASGFLPELSGQSVSRTDSSGSLSEIVPRPASSHSESRPEPVHQDRSRPSSSQPVRSCSCSTSRSRSRSRSMPATADMSTPTIGLVSPTAPPMPLTRPPPVPVQDDGLIPHIQVGHLDSAPVTAMPFSSPQLPKLPYANGALSRSLSSIHDLGTSSWQADRPMASRRNSHIRAANRISTLTLQVPGAASSGGSDASSIRSSKIGSNRRSWFGSMLRQKEKEIPQMPRLPDCWEIEPEARVSVTQKKTKKKNRVVSPTIGGVPYDLDRLLEGQVAAELWINGGDTDVHLFPGARSVFRVPSSVFAQSRVLLESCMVGNGDDRSAPMALVMPLGSAGDAANSTVRQRVMAARNLFAFLLGKPLVASAECPTAMAVLAAVAELLSALEFVDSIGSFGPVVATAFERTVNELQLADMCGSGRRIIDALVLAERFKCTSLYTEAFAHAAGMRPPINTLSALAAVSPATRTLIERSAFDLSLKIDLLEHRFKDMQFRDMFSGAMTGKSAVGKMVSYQAWHASFHDVRSFVLEYLKSRYGHWPPHKRDDLPSITRIQARHLYADFAGLYDLLVDKTRPTTRKEGELAEGIDANIQTESAHDRVLIAIRRVLAEYDESAPPVLPAMPFDVPRLPALPTGSGSSKATTSRLGMLRAKPVDRRKLHRAAIPGILSASQNVEAIEAAPETSLVRAFLRFELTQATGKSVSDLIQQRCGVWLFVYACMQSLPLLVIDAPGVQFSKGVEYYLCQIAPVNNPANPIPNFGDVDFGMSVDAVMSRSHPWVRAREWSGPALPEFKSTTATNAYTADPIRPVRSDSLAAGARSNAQSSQAAQFYISTPTAGSPASGVSPVLSSEPMTPVEMITHSAMHSAAQSGMQSDRSGSGRSASSSVSASMTVADDKSGRVDSRVDSRADSRASMAGAIGLTRRPSSDAMHGNFNLFPTVVAGQQQHYHQQPVHHQHQHSAGLPVYLQSGQFTASPPLRHRTSLSSQPNMMMNMNVHSNAQSPMMTQQYYAYAAPENAPVPAGMAAGLYAQNSMSMPHLVGPAMTPPMMTPVTSMNGLVQHGQKVAAAAAARRAAASVSSGSALPSARHISMTFDDILAQNAAAAGADKGGRAESVRSLGKRRSWWVGGSG